MTGGVALTGSGTMSEMQMKLAVLERLCAKAFTQEGEVLQFMVEIRKIDELHDHPEKYPILAFFCDWLVHPILDRRQAQAVLKGLDDFIERVRQSQRAEQGDIDVIAPLLSFKLLQHELAVFLSEHGLPTSPVDGEEWFQFLSLYVDQIERVELKSQNPAKTGLRHIDAINIKKSCLTLGAPAGADERFEFRIVWTFNQSGRQTFEISTEIWSPKVRESREVPVLTIHTFEDGTSRTVAMKSHNFFDPPK